MRKILCTLVAGLCFVAACGDDDDSSSSKSDTYVDAISTSLNKAQEGPSFTNTEAKCIAQGIVDSVGVKALEDADVTADKLGAATDLASLNVDVPSDAKDKLAKSLKDCKVTGILKDQIVYNGLGPDMTLTAPSIQCLTDEIDDDLTTDTTAAVFLDSSADTADIETAYKSAVTACPGTMDEMLTASGLGDLYGEDGPDDAAVECTGAYIEANAEKVSGALTGGDDAAVTALTAEIAAACPAAPAAPAA
jgi:hypothetical protein